MASSDARWGCLVCSYAYDPRFGDPDNGVAPGTAFADVPKTWVCPWCGAGKDQFVPEEEMWGKTGKD